MEPEELEPEELKRIIEVSRYVHDNAKIGQPEWIWKNRQRGFERYQAEDIILRTLLPKEQNVDKDIFALAVKIIKGGEEFTQEELQLQANEPEALENKLNELNELLNKKRDE
jgi:hypothetical protein